MKSPFTGKPMKRVYEKRTWNFRGEQYEYMHSAWLCEDTGEQFTDDDNDMAGFNQVSNCYRAKYGIPYTDEIINIRRRYDISASKMSLILGIGINQYRLYEQGEVPSVSNGRLIRSIMNPKVMCEMVESARNELSQSDYDKIMRKVKSAIGDSGGHKIEQYEIKRIFSKQRSEENGYAELSLERLKNIMLYILVHCTDVWCTKMNKLLFYIDFLSYRERGMAMTGLAYKAIDFGPVPDRWDRIYSEFPEVRQELRLSGDFVGNILDTSVQPDISMFAVDELKILETVCTRFGTMSSREISQLSHNESAWLNYHENHEYIAFSEAFSLSAV